MVSRTITEHLLWKLFKDALKGKMSADGHQDYCITLINNFEVIKLLIILFPSLYDTAYKIPENA